MTALTTLASWTGQAWSTWDRVLVHLSIPAWIICLACLSPAVWRLLYLRGRYLDPIWALVFLLALNRLMFLLHLSSEGSHATALLLALAMAWLSVAYQREDKGRSR